VSLVLSGDLEKQHVWHAPPLKSSSVRDGGPPTDGLTQIFRPWMTR